MRKIGRTLATLSLAASGLLGLLFLLAPASAAGPPAPVGEAPPRAAPSAPATPTQVGQAAFAAISEIVSILESDPTTDWARVDIAALRAHLVDMDLVTMEAQVAQRPVPEGVEMTLEGPPAVMDAARRMVRAHSAMVGADRGWKVETEDRGETLIVTWTTPRASEVPKLRALGFYGFMVEGSHHQMHHLMIATGTNPHGGGG